MKDKVKYIIAKAYESDDFKLFINQINPSNFRDDLRQDIALIMLGMQDDKVMNIYNSGGLQAYIRSIAMYSCKSTNKINKLYNTKSPDLELLAYNNILYLSDYNYSLINERENYINKTEIKALRNFKNTHWYERSLIELYIEHGSYRAIEQITKKEIGNKTIRGIPYNTAYKTITKALCKIKEATLKGCLDKM